MKKLALLPLTLLFSEHLTYGFTCIPTSTSTVFLSRVRNASHSPAAQRSQSSQLMAFFNDNQDEEDDSIDDNEPMPIQSTPESLENARQQFELMMAMPKDNTEKNEKELEFSSMDEEERFNHGTRTISKAVLSNLNSPPPLTAILKERRLKEIDLLSSLHSSDNAINELWSLWVAERGHDASSKLLHAEELISVESWTEAEMALSVPQYCFKKLTYQSPLSRNVYLCTSFRKYFNKYLNIIYLLRFASRYVISAL